MPQADKQSSYNFIDLFAGAGGLSEGFLQAGFRPVAHVEMNEYAAKGYEADADNLCEPFIPRAAGQHRTRDAHRI